MIKECPVILNNSSVSVVKFDNTEIQFPPVGKNTKSVKVKYENGKYSIVTDAVPVRMGKMTYTKKQRKQSKRSKDCLEVNN